MHPDNGGNEELFKQMQQEFARLFDSVKDVHVNKDGETYRKTGEYATSETAQEFMDIVDQLMKISGINIEICGSWLWISGDTKPAKDTLKVLGCRWSNNKQMWYYHRDQNRRFHKKPWTIDQIRNAYGSQGFRKTEKIEAEMI